MGNNNVVLRVTDSRSQSVDQAFTLAVDGNSPGTDYHVGPSQPLSTISSVPWATLNAGDRVYIHWRAEPYREKWVINRQGNSGKPNRNYRCQWPIGSTTGN